MKTFIRDTLFEKNIERLEFLKKHENDILNGSVDVDLEYKKMKTFFKIKIDTNETNEFQRIFRESPDEYIEIKRKQNFLKARAEKDQLEIKIHDQIEYIWTFINCLYIFGGMLGAYLSKFVLEVFGRKNGFILNNLFSVIGSLIVFITPFLNSMVCIMISRFTFGIHGGNMFICYPKFSISG